MFGPENPWEVNRGLTSLDLGDNDLVLEGAAFLAGALQVNPPAFTIRPPK